MTTKEHMDNLANRYARALVRFHMTDSQDDWAVVCELQHMLNCVCQEMAEELLEGVEAL